MAIHAIGIDDIHAAAERLAGRAHRTPVATCSTIDQLAGRQLVFKCEHLQKTGSFKFRGACNAVSLLTDDEARRGVVTHSSGNHAQALALAARMRRIQAFIVMPQDSVAVKRAAAEAYGATVIECEPSLKARETTAARIQNQTGATFVHPYDNPHIIAGQGTAVLELFEQAADLDAILAPVGGGGLLAGSCIAAHGIRPATRIFAAEPSGADDAARSLASGRLIPQENPRTIADGLRTGLGELTWPVLRDHVEDVITVEDEEIIAAMRLAWERAKLLIEASGAVALAAALSENFKRRGGIRRVGVLLSGGNVDLATLPL